MLGDQGAALVVFYMNTLQTPIIYEGDTDMMTARNRQALVDSSIISVLVA